MRTPRRTLLLALAALVSAACYDPRLRARLACGENGECPGDQRCVDKVCGGDPIETDGGFVFMDADLVGPYDLTVHLAGPAVGQVRSTGVGIVCGADCSQSYPRGTQVMLRAELSNGAGLRFAGWRGACAGIDPECLVRMDGPRDVTAEFAPITHNLVFVTRSLISTQLGSAAQYDARCNNIAAAAGLNNLARDGFTAWISDASSTALQRLNLTGARGFVRMDGLPFTPSMSDLVVGNVVYNPVLYDEGGREVLDAVVTGNSPAGDVQGNCTNWNGTGRLELGRSEAGPVSWTALSDTDCTTVSSARIYCFQHTQNAALDLMSQANASTRAIFVTKAKLAPLSTLAGADDLCAREAPVGPTVFKALLPRIGLPASQMLNATTVYTTMSGQLLGSGLELISNGRLRAGIWEHADTTFFDDTMPGGSRVLTGSFSPAQAAQTPCGNLASTAGTTPIGTTTSITGWWNPSTAVAPCTTSMLLYCLQQ